MKENYIYIPDPEITQQDLELQKQFELTDKELMWIKFCEKYHGQDIFSIIKSETLFCMQTYDKENVIFFHNGKRIDKETFNQLNKNQNS